MTGAAGPEPAQDDAVFTRGNLMRHVALTSVTSSLGLIAIYAVDLIDLVFISMLGHRELAAAAGYASTLMFFASSINIGLSIAAGALVSRYVGMHNKDRARDHATSVAILTVIAGVVVPLVMLSYVETLLGLLGARPEVAALAASYLWIVLPFTFLSGLSMVAVSALRAHGDVKRGMYPALAGALTNLLLDPLFIFTLGLGLDGAAWATVAARIVTVIMALGYATRLYTAFGRVRPTVCLRLLGTALRIAIPAVLTNLAAPLGTAIVTREMAKFGPEAVAGMAIVGRLTPVAFAVVMATSGAIGPIVGQNLGAGFLKRIRTTIQDGLLFILLYVLAMSGLLFVLSGLIADLFQANGDARLLVLLFCGPLSLMQFFNGAVSLAGATFENLGHPGYSTMVNWGRSTIGTLPFVMIGSAYYGPQGILIGQALGGVLFGVLAVFCALYLLYRPARRIRKFGFKRSAMMQDLAYFGRG